MTMAEIAAASGEVRILSRRGGAHYRPWESYDERYELKL